jgi:hypothetical protein
MPGDRVQVRAMLSYVGTGTAAGLGQIVFQPVVTNWTDQDTLVTREVWGSIGGPPDGVDRWTTRVRPPPDFPDTYPFGRPLPWWNSPTQSTYLRGHVGTGTAAGLLRIAQAHVTNWIGQGPTSGPGTNNNFSGGGGVEAYQIANPARLPTDPPFDTRSVNILLFTFAFDVGPGVRDMVVSTPPNAFNHSLQSGQWVPNIRWFASINEATPSIQTSAYSTQAIVHVVPAPATLALVAWGVLQRARRRRQCVPGPGPAGGRASPSPGARGSPAGLA